MSQRSFMLRNQILSNQTSKINANLIFKLAVRQRTSGAPKNLDWCCRCCNPSSFPFLLCIFGSFSYTFFVSFSYTFFAFFGSFC